MKPSAAEYILSYLGSALILAGVFHKPLGLPEYTDIIFFLAAAVCLVLFSRVQRRRKSQASAESSARSRSRWQRLWENKSKRFWLMVTVFAVVSVANAFVGPYLVENLSFSQSVISSVIGFVILAALALFVLRRQRP
jgi:membrane protein implicated in regulation of membrane protease activity